MCLKNSWAVNSAEHILWMWHTLWNGWWWPRWFHVCQRLGGVWWSLATHFSKVLSALARVRGVLRPWPFQLCHVGKWDIMSCTSFFRLSYLAKSTLFFIKVYVRCHPGWLTHKVSLYLCISFVLSSPALGTYKWFPFLSKIPFDPKLSSLLGSG